MSYGAQLKESQSSLRAFVESKVYNQADAHDIIQNVNEVALNKESSFDTEKNFEAWVIGIAKYQILNYLKKNKNSANTLSLDVPEGEGYVVGKNLSQWLSDIPFADIVERERRDLKDQIRGALTKKQKIIFDLTVRGLRPRQIAKLLDMKLNTVTTLKFRMLCRAKSFIARLNALNGYDYPSKRAK